MELKFDHSHNPIFKIETDLLLFLFGISHIFFRNFGYRTNKGKWPQICYLMAKKTFAHKLNECAYEWNWKKKYVERER